MLVRERLSDAERNAHPVLAVIRGSAVNQDGASNGLTAPNGPAQQRVIRAALANARLAARDVDVVEAHGTGTRLGDPIEAQALLATYGADREHPLLLGSLKSNIGHTVAAAGIGGAIKMVMAMRHGLAPKSLHISEPTPHVDWSAGTVAPLVDAVPWPRTGRPRRAAVSGFAINGTNAHLILEQAADQPSTVDGTGPAVYLLSARTPAALPALWRSHGVEPDAVVGHSQGEVAAAYVAGGLSLRDAARIVAVRSRAALALAGRGGMASVPVPADRIDLTPWRDRLSVAAVNAPGSVAVAGDLDALDELLAAYPSAHRIPGIDTAAHTAQVEALRVPLMAGLAPVTPMPSRIPFYSTVTGGRFDTTGLDAAYWYRNMREPVRFERAVRNLRTDGHRAFIEVAPHPVLRGALRETPEDAAVVGTLQRDDGGQRRVLLALAEAHTQGVDVDWTKVLRGQRVDLPTYPFQRSRHWLDPAPRPLLDTPVEVAGTGDTVSTGRISLRTHPWLADHAFGGTVLFPGTGFVELATAAGDQIEELSIGTPLVLPERGEVAVQVLKTGRRIAAYART